MGIGRHRGDMHVGEADAPVLYRTFKLVWSELHPVWSEMGGSMGPKVSLSEPGTTAPSKLLCGFMMINFLIGIKTDS